MHATIIIYRVQVGTVSQLLFLNINVTILWGVEK